MSPTNSLLSKTKRKQPHEETAPEPLQSETAVEVLAETEALLDEIDRLLNANTITSLRETLEDLDDVKPFTLADAIREGSSVTDQAIGTWAKATGETCALSAAVLSLRARGLV